jgi:hypothetical protein
LIVRLTNHQFDTVLGALTGPLAEYITGADSTDSCHITSTCEWSAIPDAFLSIGLLIMERCEWGANPSVALVNAGRRIMHEVNAYRTHPAFQGVSLIDHHYEVMTGWARDGVVRPFLQEGLPTSEFAFLIPVTQKRNGQYLTTWHRHVAPTTWGKLPAHLDEAEHRRFEKMVLAPHQHPSLQ